MTESVMPGYEFGTWNGVMLPAQSPQAIVSRLNEEINKALQDPEVRDRLEQQGAEPRGTTVDEYVQFVRRETERWTTVIRTADVKLD